MATNLQNQGRELVLAFVCKQYQKSQPKVTWFITLHAGLSHDYGEYQAYHLANFYAINTLMRVSCEILMIDSPVMCY